MNVILRRSAGMAKVSPAVYLVKRSRSTMMVLVVAESACDHKHI